MCIICKNNYDDNLTELDLNECKQIKEIPILHNLQYLDCDFGRYYGKKKIQIFYKQQNLKRRLLHLWKIYKLKN